MIFFCVSGEYLFTFFYVEESVCKKIHLMYEKELAKPIKQKQK